MFSNGTGLYLLLTLPFMALGLLAQRWVKRSFARWSQVDAGGPTGEQVARQILAANGLGSMAVEVTPGELSDHYDPRTRVIRLSAAVASSRSVASVAVAAHECGHAIQHARGMAAFRFRGVLAGPVGLASNYWMILLMAGFFLHSLGMIKLAIGLYAVAVLFHIVTLPVEFDASRRAMGQLRTLGLAGGSTVLAGSRNVLTAAAMTYVVGALAAIAQLLYFALQFLDER